MNISSKVPYLHLRVMTLETEFPIEALYTSFFKHNGPSFILESGVVREGLSRFSYIGESAGPLSEVITYSANTGLLLVNNVIPEDSDGLVDPFQFLDLRLKSLKREAKYTLPFEFDCGYVTALSYALGSGYVHLDTISPLGHAGPDFIAMLATRMVVYDYAEKKIYMLYLSEVGSHDSSADVWFTSLEHALLLAKPPLLPSNAPVSRFDNSTTKSWLKNICTVRFSEDDYLQRIARAKSKIRDGESYEVCLTNMYSFPYNGDPFDVYSAMRTCCPAPFAAYVQIDGFAITSASPERFISVSSTGFAEAKPIKGTRARAQDASEDRVIATELANCEKDIAENLMIVDLLRNDIGRLCKIGSVQVLKLFDVETYSHVHQLVSTIQGQLNPGVTAIECVKNAFPGGSMTGAPKVRTMEIIDTLEEGGRGFYSGALGWFGLSGACDLNILIRSVFYNGNMAYFGVGGAITSLSNPHEEYEETIIKAKGIAEAINLTLSA